MDEDIVRLGKKLLILCVFTQRFLLLIKFYSTKFLLHKVFIFVLSCIICYFCVYLSYIHISGLDILSEHISRDITNMNPVDGDNNPGNVTNASGSNQSGGPNPGGGPRWRPYHYLPNVREDGNSYPVDNPSPALVLETYDPANNIPVQNDRQLGVLIDYRYHNQVRPLGYSRWNVATTFPSDSMVDKIAKERLLAHIYDHRSELPSAYAELDMRSGTPKWHSVKITSYLINSLNNSNN